MVNRPLLITNSHQCKLLLIVILFIGFAGVFVHLQTSKNSVTSGHSKADVLFKQRLQSREVQQYPQSAAFDGRIGVNGSESAFNGTVALYWLYHSDLFSYINYKSLESILSVYPHATVRIRIVGPEHAEYYKVGNILSKQTFQKYLKQGHRLRIEVQYAGLRNKVRSLLPGSGFWSDALAAHYSAKHIAAMREYAHVPHHITFYDRLVTLYLHGGLSSDFHWMHVSGLPALLSTARRPTAGMTSRLHCPEQGPCVISTVMLASPKHPAVLCMLRQHESNGTMRACLQGDLMHVNATVGMQCVQQIVDICFRMTDTENVLLAAADSCAINGLVSDTSLWSAHDRNTMFNTSLWDAFPLLWLGERAADGSWLTPDRGSLLHGIISRNNAILLDRVNKHLNSTDMTATERHPQCSSYYSYPSTTQAAQAAQRQGNLSCALHFVIPGFMKAGSSFIYETLVGHPLVVRALRGTQFKETGCYLPQRMGDRQRHSRLNCFPFVEPHDKVIFGDATVYYSQSPNAPEQLLRDSPQIKVLFTLRHPVSRAESQHRFDYYAFQKLGCANINDCLMLAIDVDGKLEQWRRTAVQALQAGSIDRTNPFVTQLMDLYSTGLRRNTSFAYFRCSNLLLHSLYFLPIFRWHEVIPAAQIRILHTEVFDPRMLSAEKKRELLEQLPFVENTSFVGVWSQSNAHARQHLNSSVPMRDAKLDRLDKLYLAHQFNAIHRFLGLPERQRMRPGGGHETPISIPKAMGLNSTVRRIVHEFMEPFNNLLAVYVQQVSGQT